MDTYVVDTHALIWFISEDRRLSPQVKQILRQAQDGEAQVLIPTLVLAELTHIVQKKKVAVTIQEVLNKINQGDGFTIVSFDFPIFQTLLSLPDDWEIHDRIIAATAIYYKIKLISRDETLRNSPKIETIWN